MRGRFRGLDAPEGGELSRPLMVGENWPATPTEEQMQRARERAEIEAANRAGTADPTAVDTAWVEERTRQIAEYFAEHEAAFNAWKSGMPHYDDERYLAIWRGEASGQTEEYVTAELARVRALREAFEAGQVPPSKIVGSGYKSHVVRGLAQEYLDKRVDELELALECQGRNLSVNQSNVLIIRRRMEKEALPF